MEARLPSAFRYNYYVMRKVKFSVNEHYHIYNRGVDKRDIFMDAEDVARFFTCMSTFNSVDPVGSIYENSFRDNGELGSRAPKLVEFIAYCLNQNHYHFIIEPLTDDGVQKFMHKLSTGYTNYFNEKYKRSGSLFQGKYKAIHVSSNEYLLHLSVYVNLNYKVHKELNKEWMKKINISSFKEYTDKVTKSFCFKSIILEQFRNLEDYKHFCNITLPEILKRKEEYKFLENFLLE